MNVQNKKVKRKRSLPLFLTILVIILVLFWTAPLPKIKGHVKDSFKSQPTAVSLSWPTYGQSAVGAVGYGLLDSHGTQVSAPMASVTKVVTALAVLKQKPLTAGSQGGTIVITPEDVANYNDYYAKGGSVIKVSVGEQISEYQALQALLLPSANNMADTLARWAFGSTGSYINYANDYIKGLGLKQTTVADASGFSSKSVSSAADLTTLGLVLMKNPVLRDIVSQTTAELPVAGTVQNTNWLLNTDGVMGIKTGNTEQAGGCYLFAAERTIYGQNLTLIGAIMGAPDLDTALTDSQPLLSSMDSGFSKVTVAFKGQVVGNYVASWGDTANITSQKDVSLVTWKTRQVRTDVKIDQDKVSVKSGQTVGTVTAVVWDKNTSGPLLVSNNLSPPSWHWRLFGRHFNG